MKLEFMPEPEEALFSIGLWDEERNTPGSVSRFINSFIDKISHYALPNTTYPVCKNKILASFRLSCLTINDWVIAFSQTKEAFTVHYVIYGPGLK